MFPLSAALRLLPKRLILAASDPAVQERDAGIALFCENLFEEAFTEGASEILD